MAVFTFRLELEAVPNWQAGDTIPLGADRMLRVIELRHGGNAEDNLVLVVKPA